MALQLMPSRVARLGHQSWPIGANLGLGLPVGAICCKKRLHLSLGSIWQDRKNSATHALYFVFNFGDVVLILILPANPYFLQLDRDSQAKAPPARFSLLGMVGQQRSLCVMAE